MLMQTNIRRFENAESDEALAPLQVKDGERGEVFAFSLFVFLFRFSLPMQNKMARAVNTANEEGFVLVCFSPLLSFLLFLFFFGRS